MILKKTSLIFITVFILLTPIGTITHELGHIFAAKMIGYTTTLQYSSMDWNNEFKQSVINRYYKYQCEIEKHLPFIEEEIYNVDIKKLNNDKLIVLLGGVLQTILFGSVALALLSYRKQQLIPYNLFDWMLVFISLFWLREPFNLLMGFIRDIINGNDQFFYGDEARIASLLGLPKGTLLLPLGIIGAGIALLVVFKIIPLKQRSLFIIGGVIGIPIGYFLWMYLLGPLVLP